MKSSGASSRLPGFHRRPLVERIQLVQQQVGLTDQEVTLLGEGVSLDLDRAGHMVENVVGLHSVPLGIATNFVVNDRDVLIPMAIEEPSVVAGASFAAKLMRAGGGIAAEADEPIMIGQIQLVELDDPQAACEQIAAREADLLEIADQVDPVLTGLGGGARGIEARQLETPIGPMVIVHLHFDVRDAMGANAVNTACERLAPELEEITGGRASLRILSNLADRRLARARASIPELALAFDIFSGDDVAQGIEQAWAFAASDPYRAATHNKGIMNGVDAVVLATGNDWRAVEAGAHAYAARHGRYTSLSTWRRDEGQLVGELEMPMALGIIGGATRVHPVAQVVLKILGVSTARELAEIVVSVGLAQNFAALRALATEGIQKGHMTLHARQVAMAA
ncbi:MAG: hydroxymethylglutaryl-CoA reductase, degradative, partial [Anaerolineae bacterium]